ncbi:hypothetical protein NYG95_06215 [Campylobacter felis]|uniref:Uncharacterized protein n=1 Tax=Campylobacter felis TaxID=2974565 RepID=A0ABT7I4N2_9BACT|nr:hypothetical protein [Campylobacter felis]MDL0147201.1 hypothetical protein [Campylobacter felis]
MDKEKRVICNLFLIKDHKITICKFYNSELLALKNEGATSFEIWDDFWKWWEEKEEYVQGDELDFAFIWDEQNPVIFQSPFFTEYLQDSIWNKSIVEKVLSKFQCDFKIKTEDGAIIGSKKKKLCLSSNITLQNKINNHSIVLDGDGEELEKETETYKHFREQREREEKERLEKLK